MNLKKLPVEELELMSYTDLTFEILKETKKPLNTPTIFKQICDLLEYSEEEYASKIGDYYTSLTTDKRFVLLDSNKWDIRDNHSVSIEIDDDDEIIDEDLEDEEETEEPVDEEDIDTNINEDLEEDDIEELAIVTDEDLEDE